MRCFLVCGPAVLLLGIAVSSHPAPSAPFEGKTFKGRIAWSADGNHNDPDDWAASPVALAIFAEAGLKDRLVHFDYNCILPATDPKWESIHAASVLGAAERYGYNKLVFHDCRKDLDGAVASIAKAINDSTADNPLYFIVAGPMEVPLLGIKKSDPAKRKFVYCISHSVWNDGFSAKYKFTNTKRDVIPTGVNWVQIRDQNQLLSTSPYGRPAQAEEWRPYHWMRDSDDAKVRFLWERMQVSTRPDPSDAGMAYFLVTGDEEADPAKLRRLLDDNVVPTPLRERDKVRIEAENFLHLEGYELEYRNDRSASHRLNVKLTKDAGHIRTRFDQPYTAAHARYDVEVRYFDEKGSCCLYELSVNAAGRAATWKSSGEGQGWTTQTIRGVEVRTGDEIKVAVKGAPGRLDYVQLTRAGAATGGNDQQSDRPWRPLPLIKDGKVDPSWIQIGWGGFVVDNDSLRTECDEKGMGLLLYPKEKFGDCQIRLDYKCKDAKSNAGVFVRIDDGILEKVKEKTAAVQRDKNGKLSKEMLQKLMEASEKQQGPWYAVHHGYEVQICDASDAYHRTGAIYSLAKAAPAPQKPPTDWKTMVITLKGNLVLVDIDGQRVTTFDPDSKDIPGERKWSEPKREPKRPRFGYIGLQNHDPGDVVYYKGISVRPLDDAPPPGKPR